MAQKTRVSSDLMGGDVDEGYGKVADAFRLNLSSGTEVGAAVAVYREGRKVVDLWGGYRNGITRTPWTQDTLVNVYSTTKGIAALTVALAVSRGLLSYDARVADYWPEFAQGGKEAITVRQLLAHQAGLPVIRAAADSWRHRRPREALAETGGAGPGVAAGHASRLPRCHTRLVRIRTHSARRPQGPHARTVFRRRDRRPARAGLPHRTTGLRRP